MGTCISKLPWRHFKDLKWDQQYHDKLYEEVKSIHLSDGSETGILVIGPSMHGKSSFINSIATISKRRCSKITNAGSDEGRSMTIKYHRLFCGGDLTNVWFGDIMGIPLAGKRRKHLLEDIKTIIKGHVKDGYEFHTDASIQSSSQYYIESPKETERVSCLVIIYDSTMVNEIHTELRQGIREVLSDTDIPKFVVLTKVDELCSDVNRDIKHIFTSTEVEEAVKNAATGFGVKIDDVLPVKNYDGDTGPTPEKNIPFLLALRTILYQACDYDEQIQRRALSV